MIGENVSASRFEAASRQGLTPLVGRGEEIALLQNRWRQSVAGEGQVVILSGEAGVGKDGRLGRRIVVEHGRLVHVAAPQPDARPIFEVDRRIQDHREPSPRFFSKK